MLMRRSEGIRCGLGAAAFGAALGWPLAPLADPAVAPAQPAAEQQKAEKEVELRGVEDTMRASDEQQRAIDSEIEFDPGRSGATLRGADLDHGEGAGRRARHRGDG